MALIKALPGVFAAVSLLFLGIWIFLRNDLELEARVPGADRPAGWEAAGARTIPTAEAKLLRFDGAPADLPGAWPQFRGPRHTGIASEETGLLRRWPAEGPRVLWSADLGEGYAGAAVRDGRVFVLDYDRKDQSDALRCFSLADGKEIWRYSYPVSVKRNHGMSRTVPAVTESRVVALGPKCHVTCADVATGELQWQLDLVKDFGATVPPWYAGQCPLVEGDRVLLAPGGAALVIAVSLATGAVIWQSPNPKRWGMTHSSILPAEHAGRRMYVYCGRGGVAGVSATDGAILWETDAWKIGIATVPTPVDLGGGRLFLSGGYNAGSLFLELRESDGSLRVETGPRLEPETFGSTQQTPLFHDGHLYGVRPDGELVCLDPEGRIVWTSGTSSRFGLGPYLIADGLIILMNDSGVLTLARATSEGYEQLAQAKVLEGHESWAPMALAGGRLLVRDFEKLVCLDVKGG